MTFSKLYKGIVIGISCLVLLFLCSCSNNDNGVKSSGEFDNGFYSTNKNEITVNVGTDNGEQWNVLYSRGHITMMDSKQDVKNLKHYMQYSFTVDDDGYYTLTFINGADVLKLKNTLVNIKCENNIVYVENIAYADDNIPISQKAGEE